MGRLHLLGFLSSPEGASYYDRLILCICKLRYIIKKEPRLLLSRPVTIKTRQGLKVRVYDTFMYGMFVFDYEPRVLEKIKLDKDSLFVDVGANLGFYTFFASSQGARVIAVEANKKTYDIIVGNIMRNRGRNIQYYNYAIWDSNGERLSVVVNKEAEKNYNSICLPGGGDIETRTLDALLAMESRIDWLKMDIEQAEVRALIGAEKTLEKTRNILLEVHTKENGIKCQEILKRSGFAYDIIDYTSDDYYSVHAYRV